MDSLLVLKALVWKVYVYIFLQRKKVQKTFDSGQADEEDDLDHKFFDTEEADDTKEEEERSLLETETNASFEAWTTKFHASLGLGDMCSHFFMGFWYGVPRPRREGKQQWNVPPS